MSLESSGQSLDRRTLIQGGIASMAMLALTDQLLAAGAGDNGLMQAFDKIQPQNFPWGWIRWLMNAKIDPAAEMTFGLVEINAHTTNPAHIHPNSAEYLHVLSGTLEHRLADQWVLMKPGDTIRIPKNVIHQARTKDHACRSVIVYNTGTRQMVPVKESSK
jgi:quercetin dioxygenase-like cupin family protein